MRPRLILAVLALAAILSVATACGEAAKPGHGGRLALRQVGNFEHPVYVAGAPGYPRLLFVIEQEGRIAVMKGGHHLARPFLEIRDRVGYDGGERGLLSVAFGPDRLVQR